MPANIPDEYKKPTGEKCPSCGEPLYFWGGYFACANCDVKITQG